MLRRFLLAGGFLLIFAPAYSQDFSHVRVDLLAEQNTITPGGSVTVGFNFRVAHGWHIYWKNPGDSGEAPSVTWTLPEGFTAGDILWPTPQIIPLNSLADYGYTNEVFLMVAIQAPPNAKPGHLERLTAHLRWLACNEICIPGDATLNLRFQIRKHKSTARTRNEYLFQIARRGQPQDLPDGWKIYGSIGKKDFRIDVETGAPLPKGATAVFVPAAQNVIEGAPAQAFHASGNSFQLMVRKSDQLSPGVKTLEGVLVIKEKKGTRGYNVTIPLSE